METPKTNEMRRLENDRDQSEVKVWGVQQIDFPIGYVRENAISQKWFLSPGTRGN